VWVGDLLNRRRLLQLAGLAGAAALGPVWVFGIEPRWVDWFEQEVRLPGLPASADGLSVVHLSDIHASRAVPLPFIRSVVDRINADAPDLVAITGDLVTEDSQWIDGVARELGRLRPRLGTYAILGNHDFWTDGPRLARALERHGVHHLRNTSVAHEGLRLVGVDDHWTGNDDLDAALAGVGRREPTLLLMHSPDLVLRAAEHDIDVALAGHTHGGQVRLPGWGALMVPSVFGYQKGWYERGQTRMYVNRGLGTLDLKVRLNCRPEVHRMILRSA
jgi:predicted MPP superfamily phosphohydrolase